ncbi:MAG TPA: hypothetical protein VNO32_34305 [Candidatus Acidoferrum sp.]|nr:hypothetical protein [Candidatus Acidoferrum sp.]
MTGRYPASTAGLVLEVGLYEVTALLRSRGPPAYILILIAETESHIRGLDDVEQGGLSIRMVAGYREAAERKILLVAEARFVPNTQFLSIPFRSELLHCAAQV